MFYSVIGELLANAGRVLEGPEARDERDRRDRRQVTRLVRRLGVIWPRLFEALSRECAILDATLSVAREATRAHVRELPGLDAASGQGDPLVHYDTLHRQLDELLVVLHAQSPAGWAEEALRDVRAGLAAAAEVQGRLVDEMLAH